MVSDVAGQCVGHHEFIVPRRIHVNYQHKWLRVITDIISGRFLLACGPCVINLSSSSTPTILNFSDLNLDQSLGGVVSRFMVVARYSHCCDDIDLADAVQ